jgi:RNA polymerase sigma-70 factor (ECF subfamily)
MTTSNLTADHDAISSIKSGNRVFLKHLYEKHRSEFVTWLKKTYGVDLDLATEIYQRAFTALYYNVREGKLVVLTSSIKTYLFAIGRNQLRDRYKSEKKYQESIDGFEEVLESDDSIMNKYEQNELKEKITALLERIGEPCNTVLQLYYFQHFAMDAIAQRMNYKTEQIAAKRKFLCLKQIRDIINSQVSEA